MLAPLSLAERAGCERDIESGSREMHGDGFANSSAGPGHYGSGHTGSLDYIWALTKGDHRRCGGSDALSEI